MNSSRPNLSRALQRLEANPVVQKIVHFAEEFGWWRVVAIPILAVLTVWVLVDIAVDKPAANSQPATDATSVQTSQQAAEEEPEETGPDPAEVDAAVAAVTNALPAGGAFSDGGDGTFRPVGTPGQDVGEGREVIVRYSVEVETELIPHLMVETLPLPRWSMPPWQTHAAGRRTIAINLSTCRQTLAPIPAFSSRLCRLQRSYAVRN